MDILRDFRPFLGVAAKQRVAQAIAAAEEKTSGEIHVHILKLAPARDIMLTAERVFHELGLHKTAGRNGVLILISKGDRRFAIWGDKGIHEKAGQPLWEKATAALLEPLRHGRHEDAVKAAIAEVSRELARHFPPDGPRKNELPDEVTES